MNFKKNNASERSYSTRTQIASVYQECVEQDAAEKATDESFIENVSQRIDEVVERIEIQLQSHRDLKE